MTRQEIYNELALSGTLDDLLKEAEKQLTKYAPKAKSVAKGAVTRGVNQALTNTQGIAETQASNLINTILDAIPSPEVMAALGAKISEKIIEELDNNVLPSLFRTPRVESLGSTNEPTLLEQTYKQIIEGIPQKTKISALGFSTSINLQQVFKKALPFRKYTQLVTKFQPLVAEVQRQVLPAVKTKATQIVGFTIINSMLLGGLITFGYLKLYESAKKIR